MAAIPRRARSVLPQTSVGDTRGRFKYTNIWLYGYTLKPLLSDTTSSSIGVMVRVLKVLDRLEHGNFYSAKGEGKGILAARLDFGPSYRVYFGRDGELLVILLAGGSKKRQQADIEAAQALWQEYKKRKRDG